MARLKQEYDDVIRPALLEKFQYANPMQAPKLDKIVINMGVGEAVSDSKKIDSAVQDLTLISGQKPVIARAKKSVATFKLREGMAIGYKDPEQPVNTLVSDREPLDVWATFL